MQKVAGVSTFLSLVFIFDFGDLRNTCILIVIKFMFNLNTLFQNFVPYKMFIDLQTIIQFLPDYKCSHEWKGCSGDHGCRWW